jgi:hypothetical protein
MTAATITALGTSSPGISHLQLAVCPIAEGLGFRLLATAQPHFFGFFHFKGHRAYSGVLVRAVALGLLGRAPAGAPPIFAGFQFFSVGGFLGNDRFAHDISPVRVD